MGSAGFLDFFLNIDFSHKNIDKSLQSPYAHEANY